MNESQPEHLVNRNSESSVGQITMEIGICDLILVTRAEVNGDVVRNEYGRRDKERERRGQSINELQLCENILKLFDYDE